MADDATLAGRLRDVARHAPQPEVHIRADGGGANAPVGRVLAARQRAGIHKVGFIT